MNINIGDMLKDITELKLRPIAVAPEPAQVQAPAPEPAQTPAPEPALEKITTIIERGGAPEVTLVMFKDLKDQLSKA